MDQGIKDVSWTNMKHTTKQEPAVSPWSNYSRELSFYDLFQAKWICFTAFSCSVGSLLLKSVLLKHSQCFSIQMKRFEATFRNSEQKAKQFHTSESLRAHKLLVPPQSTQSPFLWQPWWLTENWGSELSQDDPTNTPDVFSLKKLKGTWLFHLWWRPRNSRES